MSDDDGFMRKSTRMAAIEAAKRIKKNAEDNAKKYPLYKDESVTQSDVMTSDNKQRQRSRKRKREDPIIDSSEDSSNNTSKCSDPSKSDDMPIKRRGRPPNPKSTKGRSRRSRNAKHKDSKPEEADYDVNMRRESYNRFLLNNEPTLESILPGPKQLHLGDGGISYKESLMRFTKGLGPTAQKVALRMLQRQGPTHQAPREPHVVDLNSINDSFKNTIAYQANQPQFKFGDYNAAAIANYKGKNIMVDDGKSERNKWDAVDNLELFFGKQKGGVKIGSGSLENKDFGNKNHNYGQVGNQRTLNQIGSFWSNYNGNLNKNVNKISGLENISGHKEVSWNASNVTPNASVYPSTNLSRSTNISSSCFGFDGEVSPFSWVLQPPMHSPTPVAPPATTISSAANDSFWIDPEFQLALALDKKKNEQETNVWSQNMWAPSQANQFLQLHPHGHIRQQPQDRLRMLIPPNIWSRMPVPGANPEQRALPFGMQQGSRFRSGNNLQRPPPGI
ncbi:hypothetical protein Hanom_Chr12g01144761 [Helianthus anomalus]